MPNNFSPMGQFQNLEVLGGGKVEWKTAPSAADYLLEITVAGELYPRFRIQANGRIEWGSGGAPPDTILYRHTADFLGTVDNFQISGAYVNVRQAQPNHIGMVWRTYDDVVARMSMMVDGTIEWGPGDVARDCVLSRRTADILNTPDRMEVGTLGVGNSEAAATPGTCVKKIEVFDAAGSSLGFLAVYGSIAMSIPARITDKIRSAIWAKISEPFSRLLR